MMCPMKISDLAHPHIDEPENNPDMIDIFLECNQQKLCMVVSISRQ